MNTPPQQGQCTWCQKWYVNGENHYCFQAERNGYQKAIDKIHTMEVQLDLAKRANNTLTGQNAQLTAQVKDLEEQLEAARQIIKSGMHDG